MDTVKILLNALGVLVVSKLTLILLLAMGAYGCSNTAQIEDRQEPEVLYIKPAYYGVVTTPTGAEVCFVRTGYGKYGGTFNIDCDKVK